MELLEYWRIFRKRTWLIVLLLLIGAASAFFYTEYKIPQYEASTTLFINPGQVSPLLPAEFSITSNNKVASLAKTYSEMIQTRSFIHLVMRGIEAQVSEKEVKKALSSSYVEDTQFFRIVAVHPDPAIAQELANMAADVLITRDSERQRFERLQIEQQRQRTESPEKQRFEELIRALEAEIAYYDNRIADTQGEIIKLQGMPVKGTEEISGVGESAEPVSSTGMISPSLAAGAGVNLSEEEQNRLDSLLATLPELRYERLDVQTRLATAQHNLSSLLNEQEKPVDTAVVVDAALFPTTPIPRKHLQNTILAAIVGLMIGMGIAMLLEYIDYTIKSPEVLDAVYGVATQGVIRSLAGKERKYHEGGYLVSLDNLRSPTAEAFRSLRTGIQVARLNAPIRSLLVTSAAPGEGKTFVTANLALSFALNNYRVILVDTDLRKPNLHKVFGLPRDQGFTSLVMNQETSLDDVLLATNIPNLRLLPCGPIPPYPSELLSSIQADQVMRKLEEDADIVIYDSPPIATVTDAALLAQRVDAVLQVVWAGHTRINLVQRAKAILEHVGARILGPVLNQVEGRDLGYSYSYYNYGYYYGEQHGEQNGEQNGSGFRLPFLGDRRKKAAASGQQSEQQAETQDDRLANTLALTHTQPEQRNGQEQKIPRSRRSRRGNTPTKNG